MLEGLAGAAGDNAEWLPVSIIAGNQRGAAARREALTGCAWAAAGVGTATALLFLARPYMDKGHASLLYLPVVLACAVRFGFGPAMLGAFLSFFCWDFFFLPPFYTFVIALPRRRRPPAGTVHRDR